MVIVVGVQLQLMMTLQKARSAYAVRAVLYRSRAANGNRGPASMIPTNTPQLLIDEGNHPAVEGCFVTAQRTGPP